jgi:hypothetical protein
MPRVLTVTQKPEESTEDFAARIADQVNSFFKESPGATTESPEPSAESTEPAPPAEPSEPTDVTAPSEQGKRG